MRAMALALGCVAVLGCGASRGAVTEARAVAAHPDRGAPPPATAPEGAAPEATPEVAPAGDLPWWDEGAIRARVTEAEARSRGLTVLDLSDAFAPRIFASHPGEEGVEPPAYRTSYLELADGRRTRVDGEDVPAPGELTLYGIVPTLRVVRDMMADAEAVRCHRTVDDAPLATVPDGTRRPSRAVLEAVEAHLACDGFLRRDRRRRGEWNFEARVALGRFQRRHALLAYRVLDARTVETLLLDEEERRFRILLRALRERVADATAWLADGSASGHFGTVLGRSLDPAGMEELRLRTPLLDGADDVVAEATDAAARALGWVSPEAARDALLALPEGATGTMRVAVALGEGPFASDAPLDVRVEIDRGDLWYEFPFAASGARRRQPVSRRPTLTVFVRRGEGWVPLVRWHTTIGGWMEEETPRGELGLRYKESPAGPAQWREVVVAPVWLPPPTTPDDELLERLPDGTWAPDLELFGPGPRSAYGLVMMPHLSPRPQSRASTAEPRYVDLGVRTHGSVAYTSILSGNSHGCHRLFNHLAVRLSGFLLAHRAHRHVGPIPADYFRQLVDGGRLMSVHIEERGHRVELLEPVPVEVLEGTIRGRQEQAPTELRRLPPSMRR